MTTVAYFENSSVLNSAEYDADDENLHITFNNGNKYTYCNVSKNRFTRLARAESAGSYFCKNIKGKYTSYGPRNENYESILNSMEPIVD